MLNVQNLLLRPDQFEEQVRRGVVMEKLQRWSPTGSPLLSRSGCRVQALNEKGKRARINFPADKFREATTATDAEVSAVRAAQERLQDSREAEGQIRVDQYAGRAHRQQNSAQDVEQHYKEKRQQFSTPEQVRASHIRFKLEGKDEAAVRKQAKGVLAARKPGRISASSRPVH